MNPDEVLLFQGIESMALQKWDGILNNTRIGLNRESQVRFQNGSIQRSSANERNPTCTASYDAPAEANSSYRVRDVDRQSVPTVLLTCDV